jgi:hypothetical protein
MNEEQKPSSEEEPKAVDISASPQASDNIEPNAPRYRLPSSVDLTKAKKNCKRCWGRGINGYTSRETPDGTERVPIICRCVSRNGGVKEDDGDRMMRRFKMDAYFHQIAKMPPEQHAKALYQLEMSAARPEVVEETRKYLRGWIEKLSAPKAAEA